MTDKDWQARALEVAQSYEKGNHTSANQDVATAILAFAREYAAEALPKDYIAVPASAWHELSQVEKQLDEARAEVERLQEDHDRVASDGAALAEENADLRAQLAAAGPVKVPDEEDQNDWRGGDEYGDGEHNGFINGWNACVAEVLRLNAPPKENG